MLYYGNVGGNDTSAVPAMQLLFGSTVIAQVQDEGRGTSGNYDAVQCHGYAKVTGNGTDTLKFQFWNIVSSDTAYAGAMAIIAIPLTDLVENSDYWFSGTNSSSEEVSDASISWETLKSQAFTLPDAGDYLVLMSGEGQQSDNGSDSHSWNFRYYVDSTEISPTDSAGEGYHEEWEDNNGWCANKISKIVNLSAGSHTFKIECASETEAISNYRRSRICVIRCASFDQFVQTVASTGDSQSTSSYVDFSPLTTTYTPNQQEYVVVLSHAILRNSSYYAPVVRLYNQTDSSAHRDEGGEYCNSYGTGSDADIICMSPIHCGQYSTAKEWRYQYRSDGGTVYIGRNKGDDGDVESNLVFWGLTTTPSGQEYQRSASDSVATSDSLSKVYNCLRTISDSISVADSIESEITSNRSAQDSIAAEDEIDVAVEFFANVSDTITTSDSVSTQQQINREVSDAVTTSDSVSTQQQINRTLSDSTSTPDALDVILYCSISVLASDSVALADFAVAEMYQEIGVAVSDPVSISDDLSRVCDYSKIFSESISVVDSLDVALYRKIDVVISDDISTPDAIYRFCDINRTVADSVSVSDQTTKETFLYVGITDSVSIVDQIARITDLFRMTSDAITTSDSINVSAAGELEASAEDSVGVSDQIASETEYQRTTSDSISSIDQVDIEIFVQIDDSVGIADSLQKLAVYDKQVSDDITVTDVVNVSVAGTVFANVSDTANISDSLSASTLYDKAISDSLVILDGISVEASKEISTSDQVNVGDSAIRGASFLRDIVDSNPTVDYLSVSSKYNRDFADSLAISDEIARNAILSRDTADSISATDNLDALFTSGGVNVFDDVSISDETSRIVDWLRNITDTIQIFDSVQVFVLMMDISIGDVVVVTEALAVDLQPIAPDSIGVDDVLDVNISYHRTPSDVIGIVDTIIIGAHEVYGETILGGRLIGDVDAFTVSSRGAVDASGESETYGDDVEFSVHSGDFIATVDAVITEMW